MKTQRLSQTLSRNSNLIYGTYRSAVTSTVAAKKESDSVQDVKPFSELPGPKGIADIPFIGLATFFKPFGNYGTGEIHKIVDDLIKDYGDIFKLRFGSTHTVIVNHPELAKTVFQVNYTLHKRPKLDILEIAAIRNNAPKGLPILEGQEWANRRKPAQDKMLRPAVVASYIPIIEKVGDDLIQQFKKKKVVEDLLFEMLNYATESVGMLCFNKRLGCLTAEKGSPVEAAGLIAQIFKSLQMNLESPSKLHMYIRTPMYKMYESAMLKFKDISQKEITEQRTHLENLEKEGKLQEYLEKEPNFMHSLLADKRLSDDEAIDLINSLFAGGIDSTANTLVFLLGNLAMNPEKQEKLYQEICDVTEGSNNVTKENLGRMSYLKACLRESMRVIFPISFGSSRILESSLVVGGYEIPKNTTILINNNAMCKDERFFERAGEFIPERWLRETDSEAKANKEFVFAAKPFGFGPRACIGQRFAENEIYIAITKIIKNFRVSVPPEMKEIKTEIRLFTCPAEPVKMTFTER